MIVAAAAAGDVSTLREFLRKHPTEVRVQTLFWCPYTVTSCFDLVSISLLEFVKRHLENPGFNPNLDLIYSHPHNMYK